MATWNGTANGSYQLHEGEDVAVIAEVKFGPQRGQWMAWINGEMTDTFETLGGAMEIVELELGLT